MKTLVEYIQCYYIDNYINEKANFLVKKHVHKPLSYMKEELANAKQDTLLFRIDGEYILDDTHIGKEYRDFCKQDVIAVCLGEGKWALTNYEGFDKYYKWCSYRSTLYKNKITDESDSGFEATEKILATKDADKEELWKMLLNIRNEFENAYIPSIDELSEMRENQTFIEKVFFAVIGPYYLSSNDMSGHKVHGLFYAGNDKHEFTKVDKQQVIIFIDFKN